MNWLNQRLDLGFVLAAIIVQIGFASAVAYFPLQVYTVAKWKGYWRLAALLPIVGMAWVVVGTVVAFLQDSNLWPLALILVSPFASLYLLALITVHHWTERTRT